MTLVRLAYLMAARAGVKVVLDGLGGDSVLPSVSRVARLVRAGRLGQAYRESAGMRDFWNAPSTAAVYLAGVREAVLPNAARRLHRWWRLRGAGVPRSRLLDPELARQAALAERVRRFAKHRRPGLPAQWDQQVAALQHPFLTVARERYDRVAAAIGVEPRDPFLDTRVIAYCLRLPARQIEDGGWIKMVLRRAMAGSVPDEVRWRRGKDHLGAAYTEALWSQRADRAGDLVQEISLRESIIHAKPGKLVRAGTAEAPLRRDEQVQLLALHDWLERATLLG